LVTDAEQATRKKEWDALDNGKLTVNRGVLFRYARDVAVSVVLFPSSCRYTTTLHSLRILVRIVIKSIAKGKNISCIVRITRVKNMRCISYIEASQPFK